MQTSYILLIGLLLNIFIVSVCFRGNVFVKSANIKSTLIASSSSLDEAEVEDKPLLVPKIPKQSWKWPPSWPFQDDFFTIVDRVDQNDLNYVALDRISKHLDAFITPGSRILEIGCADYSLVSSNCGEISRISLSANAFGKLNSDTLTADNGLPFESESFDYVVCSSGVEGLADPRDLFREVWRVLKSEGRSFICFTSKPNSAVEKPVKMWTTMTDEQKIWIAGSYYQYSAGDGFTDTEGFDLFDSSKGLDLTSDKLPSNDTAFVVHSRKALFPAYEDDKAAFIRLKMSAYRYMENSDKQFINLRINTTLQSCSTSDEQNEFIQVLPRYQQIYAILKDVKEVVFPSSVRAMLASYLLESWTNSPTQIVSLRMAVGLDPPDDFFWKPIGGLTEPLSPKDRIHFLACIISYIGSSGAQVDYVQNLPGFLAEVIDLIEKQAPDMETTDVRIVATEYINCEYLKSRQPSVESTKNRILSYLREGSTVKSLQSLAADLKSRWTVSLASIASTTAV